MSSTSDEKYCNEVEAAIRQYIHSFSAKRLEQLFRVGSIWIYEHDVERRIVSRESFAVLGPLVDGYAHKTAYEICAALLFEIGGSDVFTFAGDEDEDGNPVEPTVGSPAFNRSEALKLLEDSFEGIPDLVGDIIERLEAIQDKA
jgi:hypothetical protein